MSPYVPLKQFFYSSHHYCQNLIETYWKERFDFPCYQVWKDTYGEVQADDSTVIYTSCVMPSQDALFTVGPNTQGDRQGQLSLF